MNRCCAAAVLLLLAFLFSACSGKDGMLDPKKPVTITVWHYYHGTQKSAFDNMVKEFNDTEGYTRGIIVEAVSYGGVDTLAENVLAAARGELDAGQMPQIFGSYGDTALEILNMGLAAEIDHYLTEQELSDYETSFLHEGRLGQDKLYVFPIAKSTDSLMINKTDFDLFIEKYNAAHKENTLSYDDFQTWEGIVRLADAYYLTTGKALMGIDALANFLIVGAKQLGEDIVKVEHGKATIKPSREVMTRLWYLYYEMMVTGRFVKLGRFCSDDIKTGDSLCYLGSTASANYFPTELIMDDDSIRPIEMVVLPMPVFEDGDRVAVSQGAGMVIAKSEKEKEYAAALFLKWFTEPERNVLFALNASYLPVTRESLKDEFLNPAFEAIDVGTDLSAQNTVKALRVGVEQLRRYTFYTSDVFDGSFDFRNQLTDLLTAAVNEDRLAYVKLLESGLSETDAYAKLLEERQVQIKCEAWLSLLENYVK